MKIYVPVLVAHGTLTFEVPDGLNLNQALEYIKTNTLSPEKTEVEYLSPNFDAARTTPEIHRNYDKSTNT
jgi:hypothetical protein